MFMVGAVLISCTGRSRNAGVVEVELLDARAVRVPLRYVFAANDRPRVRVRCTAETAIERCALDFELRVPGASIPVASRAVRGDAVLLSFASPAFTSRGAYELEAGGRTIPVEVIEVLPPVEGAAALDARIADVNTPPLDRLDAMKERARLDSREGKIDRYRKMQEARAEQARALGYISEASDAWSASAYFAYRSRDFEAMDALLDRAEALDPSFVLGRVRSALVRGYAARELGRYREALRVLEEAATTAWSYGYDADHAWVEKALGALYLELGQPEQALEQLRRLEPYFRAKDERAQLAFVGDLAWVELEAVARGASRDLERANEHLEEGLRLARKLGAHEDEAVLLTNALWAAQLAGDRAQARARIAELEQLPEEALGLGRLSAMIAEATFAVEERRLDAAISGFTAALDRAAREHAGPSSYVWRALYGRARAQALRGDAALAKADFLAAQSALETLALQADVQTSRARFFDDADQLSADAVRFFIDRGEPEEAFLAAERARTYVLLSIELQVRSERLAEKERRAATEHRSRHLELRAKLEKRTEERKLVAGAELPAFDAETEALARAASGELGALYAMLDRDAPVLTGRIAALDALWRVLPRDAELISFARAADAGSRSSTAATTPACAQSSARSSCRAEGPDSLMAFVLSEGRVRVERFDPAKPLGALLRKTGHAYLVAGALSVEQLADRVLPELLRTRTASILPYAGALLRPSTRSTGAPLVVADPKNDLPFAREEGARVARALDGAALLHGDAATERAVREKLAGASLFHFAGHGQLAAIDPWQSRLQLRDGALSLEKVLIAAPNVRTVVLSGCETGRGASLSRTIALGLPEAFLMSGAEQVLATTGRVGDEEAARFVERFYADGGREHPARAFRSAFNATRPAEERGSRSHFYLMGRADEG